MITKIVKVTVSETATREVFRRLRFVIRSTNLSFILLHPFDILDK